VAQRASFGPIRRPPRFGLGAFLSSAQLGADGPASAAVMAAMYEASPHYHLAAVRALCG
jgi:hypothetical protein